jgi:hypothetical protein
MMKQFKRYISLLWISVALLAVTALSSCIEDGITTSASDQPTFSTDTLRMGDMLTLGASPTSRFVVYNNHDKILNISQISFRDDDAQQFRMNVDGISGRSFNNIEIRPNDSIFVFVEATLAENGSNLPVEVLTHIDFVVNGVTSTMPVSAKGQDVTRLSGETVYTSDTTFSADKPYLVSGNITVEEGATLTIPAGAKLMMHDSAELIVNGSLRIEGTVEKPVEIVGDRTGYVASTIPYEVMSGQWRGIYFNSTSANNYIANASIRNSEEGLVLDRLGGSVEQPALTIINTVVRNTKGYIIEAIHSSLTAIGCVFADASYGVLRLVGSEHVFNQCTLSNNYLFTAIGGPALQFEHIDPNDGTNDPDDADLPWLAADISNTIIYGLGTDLSHGDLDGFPVTLCNCLLKSAGTDDNNFINCLWDSDPIFNVDRETYLFDYRVSADSPALNAGDPGLLLPAAATDLLGTSRLPLPTLGAYQSPY